MQIQDIIKYLKIIRKWWWVIALLFLTTVGTMVTIAFLTETQYEATVTVLISAPPPQEAPLYSQFGRSALSEEIVRTRDSFSELLVEGQTPGVTLAALPDVEMTADELRENITLENPDSVNLLRLHVLAPRAKLAARLANKLIEVGLEQYGELLASPTIRTRTFIEQQFELAKEELDAAQVELEQYKIENKIGDMNSAVNSQQDLIKNLRLQSDRARVAGDTAEVQELEKIILEREAELQNIIGLSAEYSDLVSRVEQAHSTHAFLLSRKTEAQIKENQIRELASIQVITPARPPKRPVAAINNKVIVLGAIASLMAGALLTFLLEYLEVTGVFRAYRREAPPEMVTASDTV